MDACLFEDAPLEHAHAPSPAVGAVVVGALPRLGDGFARCEVVAGKGPGCVGLERLELGEDAELQVLEPGASGALLVVVGIVAHGDPGLGGPRAREN